MTKPRRNGAGRPACQGAAMGGETAPPLKGSCAPLGPRLGGGLRLPLCTCPTSPLVQGCVSPDCWPPDCISLVTAVQAPPCPGAPSGRGARERPHSPLKSPDSLWCLSNRAVSDIKARSPRPWSPSASSGLSCDSTIPPPPSAMYWSRARPLAGTANSPVLPLTPKQTLVQLPSRLTGLQVARCLPASLLPSALAPRLLPGLGGPLIPRCGPLTWSRCAAASGSSSSVTS